MSDRATEVLVLGIGNVLWADEGFGVRAVEALHEAWVFPPAVHLMDGGTLGLELFEDVASARCVVVFDAVDCGLAPGTLTVLRDAEVPAWGARRISPHQNGFNDVLALAQLRGSAPERVTAIGVQPVTLDDFGGSLCAAVKARLPEALALAVAEITRWGFAPTSASAAVRSSRSITRRSRSRRTSRDDLLPATLAATAIRACWRCRAGPDGSDAMCIGVPMKIVSCADGMALAVGRGVHARLNALMIDDPQPGTWVLSFQGLALRAMSEKEAAESNSALDALSAVLAGDEGVGVHFSDLIDREPQLPAHLRGVPS
jgi:hydrogenase assembly chaperone HypC/HupF/hydrogenase expression/formation protein